MLVLCSVCIQRSDSCKPPPTLGTVWFRNSTAVVAVEFTTYYKLPLNGTMDVCARCNASARAIVNLHLLQSRNISSAYSCVQLNCLPPASAHSHAPWRIYPSFPKRNWPA